MTLVYLFKKDFTLEVLERIYLVDFIFEKNMINYKLTSIYQFFMIIYCLLLVSCTSIQTSGIKTHKKETRNINDVKHQSNQYTSSKQFELAQEQFIGIFGMSKVPKPRRHLYIPQYMLDRYHAWSKNLKGEKISAEKFIQAVHHDEEKSTTNQYGNKAVLYFAMNQLKSVDRNIFRSADLHLRKLNIKVTNGKTSLMALRYLKSCNDSECLEDEEQIKLPSRPHLSSDAWDIFNVTKAVHEWLHHPTNHLGFSITTWSTSNPSNQYRSKNQTVYHLDNNKPIKLLEKQWEERRPFIVLHFDKSNKIKKSDKVGKKHTRTKRQTELNDDDRLQKTGKNSDLKNVRVKRKSNKREHRQSPMESTRLTSDRRLHSKAKKHACRKRPMYLNFNAVGWSEWIIAPAGYDVFYCSGICPKPLGPHYNTTNHAVIQNQVNSFDPQLVPAPCCIPTELEAITILYLNEQSQITLKNYQQMAVVGCGCR